MTVRPPATTLTAVLTVFVLGAGFLGVPPASARAVAAALPPTATYVPLTPARLLDSRNGTGLSGASATYASPVGGATAHVLFEVAGYFQTHD